MSDVAIVIKENCFDLNIKNGDLEADGGLETAVAISLFTDRRVNDEELPDLEIRKRGFWGDMFPEVDQDKIGSRLWTLARSKQTTETLRRAEDFCREALNWLIEDGVADSIRVTASYISQGFMQIEVRILRPSGDTSRFNVVWNAQEIKRG